MGRPGPAQKGRMGKARQSPKGEEGKARPLLRGRMGRPGHAKRKGEGQARSKKERKEKGEARPGPKGKGGQARPKSKGRQNWSLGCVILRAEFTCHDCFFHDFVFHHFLFAQVCHNFPDSWCELLSCRLTGRDHTTCSVQALKSFNIFFVHRYDPSTRVRRARFSHIVGTSSDCVMVLVMDFVLSSFCFFMFFCHAFFS